MAKKYSFGSEFYSKQTTRSSSIHNSFFLLTIFNTRHVQLRTGLIWHQRHVL